MNADRTAQAQLLRELMNNHAGIAASLDEAKAKPGTVAEVDEETYFYFLEVLPPHFLAGPVFGFAEGFTPYTLFWQSGSRYFARQLTRDETDRLAQLTGIPRPGEW